MIAKVGCAAGKGDSVLKIFPLLQTDQCLKQKKTEVCRNLFPRQLHKTTDRMNNYFFYS